MAVISVRLHTLGYYRVNVDPQDNSSSDSKPFFLRIRTALPRQLDGNVSGGVGFIIYLIG